MPVRVSPIEGLELIQHKRSSGGRGSKALLYHGDHGNLYSSNNRAKFRSAPYILSVMVNSWLTFIELLGIRSLGPDQIFAKNCQELSQREVMFSLARSRVDSIWTLWLLSALLKILHIDELTCSQEAAGLNRNLAHQAENGNSCSMQGRSWSGGTCIAGNMLLQAPWLLRSSMLQNWLWPSLV